MDHTTNTVTSPGSENEATEADEAETAHQQQLRAITLTISKLLFHLSQQPQ